MSTQREQIRKLLKISRHIFCNFLILTIARLPHQPTIHIPTSTIMPSNTIRNLVLPTTKSPSKTPPVLLESNLHPPDKRDDPYATEVTQYWGDFPSTQHIQSPTSIFRFVHFNINGIKYENQKSDNFESFSTNFNLYVQDLKPSITSINEHNLDTSKTRLRDRLKHKITKEDKQAAVCISDKPVPESSLIFSHRHYSV